MNALFLRCDLVPMRGWEAILYRVYNNIMQGLYDLFCWPRQHIVKAKEHIMRQFEYYLDDGGRVRIRRNTGKQGIYKLIEGKVVKVSSNVATVEDMMIIPWKEANAGYYDEELGTHIESKKQYRQLMKKKKLIPLESTKYCGSRQYRKQKAEEARSAEARKMAEKAFINACRSGLGDAIRDGSC